jgi:acetyltransferase-like isoleucine patch superfamily enzyme
MNGDAELVKRKENANQGLAAAFRRSSIIFAVATIAQRCVLRFFDQTFTIWCRMGGARIGRGSIVEFGVVMSCPRFVTVGNGCRIQRGTVIGAEILKGRLVLEDYVQVNRNVLLDHSADLTLSEGTVVSEGALIYTHSHGLDPKAAPTAEPLYIGARSWVGARAMILPSVSSIGEGSVVGAAAVLTKDLGGDAVAVGNPAKVRSKVAK